MVSITSHPGSMLPPPTPALLTKRPSYGLKRDSSYLDTDDEASLSTTTKKLKVAFDPRIDVRIMDNSWGNKSMDLVKEEVKIGLERHLAHDDEQYSKLVNLLQQDPYSGDATSSQLLLKYIITLDSRVSQLGECGKLVMAALETQWLGRDEIFLASYVKLVVSLSTAHSKYLQAALDRLVVFFTHCPASYGRLPGERVVSRSDMLARVHMVINTLVRQIPAASNSLIKALRSEFPKDISTARVYQQYQKHMLVMCEYAQEIKSEIMAMIVQRVVALDVQIQLDFEDLEEEAEDKLLNKHMQSLDAEESDESDAESVSSSEETTTEEEERMKELKIKVAKMDNTMDLLFEHYNQSMQDTSTENSNTYTQLLNHFTTFVLPHRTRHAQFLLFHFSQTSDAHILRFAQRCIEQGFGDSAVTQRYTAIAYLSSFVARAAHVSRDTVQEIFSILCDYLEQMRIRYEPACKGPDRRTYMLYYAVAQALLYIFCFRWRCLVIHTAEHETNNDESEEDDILADKGELTWMPGIREILQKNIFGLMNPLKVCSPAIVTEFANIARHVRFMEVLSRVESNKRLRLGQTFSYYALPGSIDVGRRETAWDRKTGDAHHQLEPYFPFDPYHLPISKQWVKGDYNEWKLPRGMKREDDDDAYYDDSDEDEDDGSDIEDLDHNNIALEVLSNSS